MKTYAIVDINNKIIQLFGWGDDRPLPSDYPKPEGTNIIGIPENFAEIIQGKWKDVEVFVKDISVIMDSTKDYMEYFTDVAKEQETPVDLQQQLNAQMLLALVNGGLM